MGPPLRRRRGRCFYVGATFVAPQFRHEYIRAVTASRSLRTLCILCHCTVLSNIYTRIAEVFCQCRLVQPSSSYIYRFSSHLTGNSLRLICKHHPVKEKVGVYCESHTKHTNTLCGQNAEFLYVKVSDTYSNHRDLKG
jgi:hypothetical protein